MSAMPKTDLMKHFQIEYAINNEPPWTVHSFNETHDDSCRSLYSENRANLALKVSKQNQAFQGEEDFGDADYLWLEGALWHLKCIKWMKFFDDLAAAVRRSR